VFGFPAKVSWPNIASLPRNVSSSSKQIPSEVNDFPIPIAYSRDWGRDPPRPPLFACLERGHSIQESRKLIWGSKFEKQLKKIIK